MSSSWGKKASYLLCFGSGPKRLLNLIFSELSKLLLKIQSLHKSSFNVSFNASSFKTKRIQRIGYRDAKNTIFSRNYWICHTNLISNVAVINRKKQPLDWYDSETTIMVIQKLHNHATKWAFQQQNIKILRCRSIGAKFVIFLEIRGFSRINTSVATVFYVMQVFQLRSLAICFMSKVLNIEVVLNFVMIAVVSHLA